MFSSNAISELIPSSLTAHEGSLINIFDHVFFHLWQMIRTVVWEESIALKMPDSKFCRKEILHCVFKTEIITFRPVNSGHPT